MVGTRSLSGFEVVLQLADGRKPETQKKEDGKFTIDVRLLQKMMGSDAGTRVFESRPQYLLIPIGLIGGALAYCLLILIAFGLWIKKSYVASGAAAICFLLTLQLITSLFLLNDLLQTTIAASFASSRDNPFADLMKNFMQGMKIEPDMAVYLLGGAAFLIAMIVWYQPANRDLHG